MPFNLDSLFMELAQMRQVYSSKAILFFDHGSGNLRVTINFENTRSAISISVERLSADLELSKETIELDWAEILPVLRSMLKINEQSLLDIRQPKKMGVKQEQKQAQTKIS